MPKDLFYENPLLIKYILRNKIIVTLLADTCATGYGFIDEKFVETVYQVL